VAKVGCSTISIVIVRNFPQMRKLKFLKTNFRHIFPVFWGAKIANFGWKMNGFCFECEADASMACGLIKPKNLVTGISPRTS
jgi:hypothetical protein